MENGLPLEDRLASRNETSDRSYQALIQSWTSPIPTKVWHGFEGAPFNLGDLYDVTGDWASESSSLPVSWDSCMDGSVQNCTSVCTNASLLFGNGSMKASLDAQKPVKMSVYVTKDLLACMYYPLISQWLGSEHLDGETRDGLNLVADRYGILPNASVELIDSIVNVQRDCYSAYCTAGIDSEFPCHGFDNSAQTYAALTGEGLLDVFPDWATISPVATMRVNPDIGGIGVSIGYIIEFSIVLGAWIFLRSLRSLKYLIQEQDSVHVHLFIEKWCRRPTNCLNPHKIQEFSTMLNQKQEELMRLVREFQKAQCFFLMPLNIAILLGIFGQTSIFSIRSLGQLEMNLLYIQCVTQGSLVFSTFTIYLLFTGVRRSEEREMVEDQKLRCSDPEHLKAEHYDTDGKREKKVRNSRLSLWGLTTVTTILTTSAWAQATRHATPDKKINPEIGDINKPWVHFCGIVSPATYNGPRWEDKVLPNSLWSELIYVIWAWFVLAGLLLDTIWHDAESWIAMRFPSWKSKKQDSSGLPGWSPLRSIMLGIIDCFMLLALLKYLHIYITFMGPTQPLVDGNFTMGQLLAIFVWSGSIFEFIKIASITTIKLIKSHHKTDYEPACGDGMAGDTTTQ